MSFNPNLTYFVERLQGFSTNTFRLETQNKSTAKQNDIISFDLPSNAILNLRSLKVWSEPATPEHEIPGGFCVGETVEYIGSDQMLGTTILTCGMQGVVQMPSSKAISSNSSLDKVRVVIPKLGRCLIRPNRLVRKQN